MPKQKEINRFRNSIITIIVLILALIVLAILYIKTTANSQEISFEDRANNFCFQQNIDSVSICNNQVIEIKSSLLGPGVKYEHRDGTSFVCPVVSPDSMSTECKAIFNAQQTKQWNCVKVC